MPAIESLRTAGGALSRNPVLFVGGLCYALLLVPQQALQFAGVPFVPLLLQVVTFFVTPFVLAGVIGMALEGIGGDTSLDCLLDVGRERYVSLLLASLVAFGIEFTFGVLFVVVAIVATLAGAGGGFGGATSLVVVAVVALLVIAYLVVRFLIQFYPVVVVVDGADAVDGITGSVDFVRDNPLSALGYTVVAVAVGWLASLPATGVLAYQVLTGGGPGAEAEPATATPFGANSGAGPPPELGEMLGAGFGLSPVEAVGLAALSAVLTALAFAFTQTYATAFYRRHVTSVEERVLDDL
jgi:hypothetical protein